MAMKLTDELILLNLNQGASLAQVAKLCGVSSDKLYHYLKSSKLSEQFNHVQMESLMYARYAFATELDTAMSTLRELATKSKNDSVRLQAAIAITNAFTSLGNRIHDLNGDLIQAETKTETTKTDKENNK